MPWTVIGWPSRRRMRTTPFFAVSLGYNPVIPIHLLHRVLTISRKKLPSDGLARKDIEWHDFPLNPVLPLPEFFRK